MASYLNLFNYYLSQKDIENALKTLETAYKDNLNLDAKDFISYLLIAAKIDLQNNNIKKYYNNNNNNNKNVFLIIFYNTYMIRLIRPLFFFDYFIFA